MFRFLCDVNFNNDILRGLLLRRPDLDVVRAQDVGLEETEDPELLAWAAANGRIVLTHDRATFPSFAYERVVAGEPMAGVFVVNDRLPPGRAIDELLLVIDCSEASEWSGRVLYLPL
jgi:predicted nuclease of predicted toxin-antitoxin system